MICVRVFLRVGVLPLIVLFACLEASQESRTDLYFSDIYDNRDVGDDLGRGTRNTWDQPQIDEEKLQNAL